MSCRQGANLKRTIRAQAATRCHLNDWQRTGVMPLEEKRSHLRLVEDRQVQTLSSLCSKSWNCPSFGWLAKVERPLATRLCAQVLASLMTGNESGARCTGSYPWSFE